MESEELSVFENLTQALYDYGEQVRDMYRRNLLANDKKVSGKLINNIKVLVAYKGTEYVVYLDLEPYWKYVEDGIMPAPGGKYNNPGWKAYPFILEWIKAKPVLPRGGGLKGTKKKLPTEKQLAYLITRKIKNEGIKPTGLLADSVEAVNRYYLRVLEDAIQRDFDKYAIYALEKAGKLVKI